MRREISFAITDSTAQYCFRVILVSDHVRENKSNYNMLLFFILYCFNTPLENVQIPWFNRLVGVFPLM